MSLQRWARLCGWALRKSHAGNFLEKWLRVAEGGKQYSRSRSMDFGTDFASLLRFFVIFEQSLVTSWPTAIHACCILLDFILLYPYNDHKNCTAEIQWNLCHAVDAWEGSSDVFRWLDTDFLRNLFYRYTNVCDDEGEEKHRRTHKR